MNVKQMHVAFRQYSQQMGMQNVRAILPEQIDLLLNTSVMDMVNKIIKENVGITNDRIITDNSKIGQVNALRTLYKVHTIDMSPILSDTEEKRTFSFSSADRNTGRMTTDFKKISENSFIPDYLFVIDFSLNYKKVINKLGYNGKTGIYVKHSYSVLTPESCVQGTSEYYKTVDDIEYEVLVETYDLYNTENYVNLKFKVDKSIENNPRLKCISEGYTEFYLGVEGEDDTGEDYGGKHYVLTRTFTDGDTNYNRGIVYNPLIIHTSLSTEYVAPTFDSDGTETNYFPVRLIDDAFLADTLNDFILKPRLRSPIIVMYNNYKTNVLDLYIDKFQKIENNNESRYVLDNDLIPYRLRMSYIGKPAQIKYSEDLGGENQDCDLPEYMHFDIVKHAVDIYRAAISGSIMATQAQEQQARQENMRNNYRNEGIN